MTDRFQSINSLLVFILGFVSGVLVSSFVPISPLSSVLVILVGFSILIAEKIHKSEIVREVFLIALLIIAFGLGILRYEIKDFHTVITPEMSGIVVSELEQKENTSRFILRSDNGEKVLVSTDLHAEVGYGDRVVVEGELERPGIIVDEEGGRPFNYGRYLAKDDIYWTLSFAEVEVVSSGHGNPVKHVLFSIKASLVGKIREILVEPESSLLAGLIVAGKASMPSDILEEFRRAGVIHIVVLSGFNVAVIAVFMRKMFEYILIRLRRPSIPLASGASIFGILAFVLMTGAEATVVRAALMVLVVIGAQMFAKSYSASRALLGAGFIMVVHNPKILAFDPSFELSFLATCGLIYITPIVEKWLTRVPNFWEARTMLSATIATQIAVLPLLAYSMGDISLVSLLANALILLFIPITMLVGFLATLVAYIHPVVALPLSYITHLLLAWILGVSHALGSLPFASVSVPLFPFWIVMLIYIALIYSVYKLDRKVA